MSVMKEEDMRSLMSEVTSVREDEGTGEDTEKACEEQSESLDRGNEGAGLADEVAFLFSDLAYANDETDSTNENTFSDSDLVKSIRIVVDNGTKVGEYHYELFGARVYLVGVGLWRFIDRGRDVIYNVDTGKVFDTIEFIDENLSSSMKFVDNICDCIKLYIQTVKGIEPYEQDAEVFKSFYSLTKNLKDFEGAMSDCIGSLLDAEKTCGGSDDEFSRRKLFERFSVSYSPEADFVNTLINALLDRI